MSSRRHSQSRSSSSRSQKQHKHSYDSDSGSDSGDDHAPASTSHLGHVRTGYLAALHNDRVSKEAKRHAKKMLEKLPGHGKVSYEQNDQARYSRQYYKDHHESSDEGSEDDEKYDNKSKYNRSKSPSSSKYSRSKSPSSYKQYSKSSSKYDHHDDDSSDDDDEPHHVPGHGRQGFASMPLHKVKEIASKGGRTRNAGEAPHAKGESSDDDDDSHYTRSKSPSYKKYSGSSSGSRKRSRHDEEDYEYSHDMPHHHSGHGRQGFASMPLHKVREIASMGGRTRHAGEEPHEKGESSSEDSGSDRRDYQRRSNNKRYRTDSRRSY